MKRFEATKNEDGQRLSRFVEKVCPTMPKGELYKAFRNRRIKINGKRQQPEYKIIEGDIIELYINDEYFTQKPSKSGAKTVKVNVLYEDDNILIAIKPFGLICHSDNKNEANLIDSIIEYLKQNRAFTPDKENNFTPALCNRLDQGTEGLIIAAKNYVALREMNKLIADDILIKQYLMLTKHSVKDGVYEAYHQRVLSKKKVYISAYEKDGYLPIRTGFRVLDSKKDVNLVECTLYTGKTHQIRAHAAFLGWPIIGDRKYNKDESDPKDIKSQMLCAYKITFKDISSDNPLNYLSGKVFEYDDSTVMNYFRSY